MVNTGINIRHLLRYGLLRLAGAIFVLITAFGFSNRVDLPTRAVAQTATRRVFLPLTASSFRSGSPILLGIYEPAYMGAKETIDTHLKPLDNWSGKGVSIVGTFIGFDDPYPNYNVPVPMELLWDNGYTAFVNLMTNRTAAQVAQGVEDGNIQEIAAAFAFWMASARQEKQERFVFIAPMPEMNITQGNTYGGDPASFIAAYRRIQDIFASEFAKAKVPFESVSWVFAPNGVDEPGRPTFEAYYPGHDRVDIMAFSSYNFGYCIGWEYDRWQWASELYLPHVQRMKALAPGKPIFIAQTATTSEYPSHNHFDAAQKNLWFVDTYAYLAGLDGVRAILYFNFEGECGWVFYRNGILQYDGYREAISSPAYEYWDPVSVSNEFSQP